MQPEGRRAGTPKQSPLQTSTFQTDVPKFQTFPCDGASLEEASTIFAQQFRSGRKLRFKSQQKIYLAPVASINFFWHSCADCTISRKSPSPCTPESSGSACSA